MKTLRTVLFLALLCFGLYAAYLIVPLYAARFQFQEAIDDAAKEMASTYTRKTEADFRNGLAQRAGELHIPLNPEDFKIDKDGTIVSIQADYTVHVDLPAYPFDLNFHTASRN